MNIRIGRFELEINGLYSLFLRVPFVGQSFLCRQPGLTVWWESWGALKACGELDRA
jgi:hypothetical protein